MEGVMNEVVNEPFLTSEVHGIPAQSEEIYKVFEYYSRIVYVELIWLNHDV